MPKNYFTCTTFWALCHSQLLSLEKVENCDDFYAKYDQLNHEADKINVDNGQYMTFPESYLRLGNLYKDMYKLAKEKKTSKVITCRIREFQKRWQIKPNLLIFLLNFFQD